MITTIIILVRKIYHNQGLLHARYYYKDFHELFHKESSYTLFHLTPLHYKRTQKKVDQVSTNCKKFKEMKEEESGWGGKAGSPCLLLPVFPPLPPLFLPSPLPWLPFSSPFSKTMRRLRVWISPGYTSIYMVNDTSIKECYAIPYKHRRHKLWGKSLIILRIVPSSTSLNFSFQYYNFCRFMALTFY